ncbi:MAG: serine--tRNA ligase, partial [Actinobacteria bacterium]|nr:serine--tRNA ligase [Actinomycetota bacterium]
MIDLKFLRENPDRVRSSQIARGEDPTLVESVIAADEARRTAIAEFEALRAEQNTLSKAVGAAAKEDRPALLETSKALAEKVKGADTAKSAAEERVREILLNLSNVVEEDVPVGGEADFKIIEHVGTPREFSFEPKDHVELGKILGAIDTERGAKVSGARFYYLTGVGALLEFALVNMAISQAGAAGFIPVIPPV